MPIANRTAGLLILGISSTGEIQGINHLSERQINSLTNIDVLLVGHTARTHSIDCTDKNGDLNKICLIYSPHAGRCFCETPGTSPKAWLRVGPQNLPLTDAQRDVIKRDKGIVNFEKTLRGEFYGDELDADIVNEFRQVYLQNSGLSYVDEEMLRRAGALARIGGGRYFTNAGYLFFASNPQQELPTSYIRLLRFNCNVEDIEKRGLPTFDKKFTGALTEQIRSLRTFFKESDFLRFIKNGGAAVALPMTRNTRISQLTKQSSTPSRTVIMPLITSSSARLTKTLLW